MPTPKTENYTAAQVQIMRDRYNPEASQEARDLVVKELADEFGKGIRSIRSKLVNEKLYVKKAAVSKVTGGEAAKKDEMSEKLVSLVGAVMVGDKEKRLNADSVAKMNKTDIQIFSTLITSLMAQNFELMKEAMADDAEASEDETESEVS